MIESNLSSVISKLISGGQTGVDRAALDVAIELEIPCGGWCPKDRLAEDGPIPVQYPLHETATHEYRQRTEWNVRDADGTLIIAPSRLTGGTRLTQKLAVKSKKPCIVVDPSDGESPGRVHRWLIRNDIHVLNVAGPRESQTPGIYDAAVNMLRKCFANQPCKEAGI